MKEFTFKQKIFSWFDSYNIYDENGEEAFKVKGELSLGHLLKIYNNFGEEIGMVKEKVLTLLPKCYLYVNKKEVGIISKELTLLAPKYNIDFNNWKIKGSIFEYNYEIYSKDNCIAKITKEIISLSDTYHIKVYNDEDALYVIMCVIAIDAIKCSEGQ